ncbi:hypothetical protein [Clostridium estertheticum]|uniref:hypothetical protein n=1 Tax=Clostridium estertheticum TaxID=238834 RepID=UPI001CF1129F|nr:hypothetical protein [Clostridium estertheticum]MCB2353291.1 hypothetical protein [Clostridium estertheticum]WAG41641.1 hypothetical protein LL065_02625 [Clostridium estertheticum]
MSKKILIVMSLFVMLLHSTVASAIGFKYVQIFDPKQDKVVKVVQLNDKIHNMVVSSIKDVDSLYAKNNPLTDDGYAIRVPIYPAVKVQGKCLNALVDNVFIIIPQHDAPFFMIFEDDNKLLCFPFKGNVSTLSKILDFKLKS